MNRIDDTGPSEISRARMAQAQRYVDEIGQKLTARLPDGFGFFLMIEPTANGTGAVSSNMKPGHLKRIFRKIAKGLPS